MHSMQRSAASRIVDLGLMLVLTTLAAEIVIRAAHPAPRAQIMRTAILPQFRLSPDGVPMWSAPPVRPDERLRKDVDCDERASVAMFGSSVTYGVSLAAEKTVSLLLKERLQSAGNPACVWNHAEPGATMPTHLALAKELVPQLQPDLMIIEVQQTGFVDLRPIGDTLYWLDGFCTDANGYPNLGLLPANANQWWLQKSRLYEYTTIALAGGKERCFTHWEDHLDLLDQYLALSRTTGTPMLAVMVPMLDRPLDAAQAVPFTSVIDWLADHDVPSVAMWSALDGKDPDLIRQSQVHFNAEGHALYADALLDAVLQQLPEPSQ